jgi:hypothetical protein
MTDHKIGMVTPINSMFNLFKLDDKRTEEKLDLDVPVQIGDKTYNRIYFAGGPKSAPEIDQDNTLVAKPATTPLLVNGLQGRAQRKLDEELASYDVVPIQGGGVKQQEGEVELKPGSAVAVQLVRGDINVSAVGTLTYRQQDRVLGFGHPFLSLGETNYLLSSAYIHKMIKSVEMPFKLGSPLDVKGIITQDRTAGVAGKVGDYPNVIPIKITVADQDLGIEETFEFQVVQNENLIQKLSASALLQAVDSTIDRRGEGTARVELELMGSGLPDRIIKKENLYYSGSDIAAASTNDFLQALQLVNNNPFREVNIANINYRVEIKQEPKLALVEQIEVDEEVVNPGEEITAQVTLRPYREEVIEKEVTITVPEDAQEGIANLHVLSGEEANLDQVLSNQQEEQQPSQANTVKSLDKLVELFEERNQNNQLVVELRSNYGNSSQPEDSETPADESYNSPLEKQVFTMDYVFQGAVRKEVRIKAESNGEEAGDNKN